MKRELEFTQEEQKIRNRWLLWQIKIPVFFSVIGCLILPFVFFLERESLVSMWEENPAQFISFITPLISLIFLYLYYHCAYKKAGVIWLLTSLVLLSISFALYLFAFLFALAAVSPDRFFIAVIMILILAYQATLFYYSLKLRRINRSKRSLQNGFSDYMHAWKGGFDFMRFWFNFNVKAK